MLAILGKSPLGALTGDRDLAPPCSRRPSRLSTTTHDKSMDVSMTSFFVTDPVGAALGLIGGLVRSLARAGS